jgi:hypothetical protein
LGDQGNFSLKKLVYSEIGLSTGCGRKIHVLSRKFAWFPKLKFEALTFSEQSCPEVVFKPNFPVL